MNAHILYYNYLEPDGSGISVGGIQTYIHNLIPVLREEGYEVSVYQCSLHPFTRTFGGATVHGIGLRYQLGRQSQLARGLFRYAKDFICAKDDLLIFGSATCVVPCKGYNSVAIQHGIFWDIPLSRSCSVLRYFRHYVGKCWLSWRRYRERVMPVRTLVCVDHNFVNWLRASFPYPQVRLRVVCNFSSVPDTLPQKPDGPVHIIFARRFFQYRGTRLFADAVARLLRENDAVRVVIAGDGPDAPYLHEKLRDVADRVEFTMYSCDESLSVHSRMHIAVVPTLGSEGTSLSLLEAMASGCAVVCTNVGGMTNIVLDHHNGLLISPEEDALYEALSELVADAGLRKRLGACAYQTVCDSFSLGVWQKCWRSVIQSCQDNE